MFEVRARPSELKGPSGKFLRERLKDDVSNALALDEVAMRRVEIIGGSKVEPADVERLVATDGVNRELVMVFSDTISWSHELMRSLPLMPQDTDAEKQKAIAAVLLARVIEVVEAGFLLASRGACVETATMFRVFLDAYFVLANFCSNTGFLSTYFRSDEAERLKLMRAASKRESDMFSEIREYASLELQSELDARIKAEKIQAFNSFAYAENVGCGHIYDSMYRISSAAVHSTPRALEKLVEVDNEGRITHILLQAHGDSANRVLYDLHHFFCKALEGICDLFKKDRAHVEEFGARGAKAVGDGSNRP